MNPNVDIQTTLTERFGDAAIGTQETCDGVPTLWISKEKVCDVLRFLKSEVESPYRMLYDLTAIDERTRTHRNGCPDSDFTVVYHLLSFDRNHDIRIKVPLNGEFPSLPTITDIWSAANWYEREV